MLLFWYSLGHFATDFVCAWLLVGHMATRTDVVTLALVYNFCAFALQMPVGILADRLGRNRLCSALGAGLVCCACLPLGLWPRVVLAGVGNALYHVGGGREILLERPGYGPLGIFVAPGAVGIFLGGLLTGQRIGLLGAALLAVCGLTLFSLHRRETPSPRAPEPLTPHRRSVLLVMLLVVLLRSFVGMCAASPWKVGLWVTAGALLGAAGKALGGLCADRWGGKAAGGASLLLAAMLFLFPGEPVCGVLAGMLFSMSMPVTLRDAAAPSHEGFVFGLMTFALFLGFLPATVGFYLEPVQTAALAALSGVALLLAAGRKPCRT